MNPDDHDNPEQLGHEPTSLNTSPITKAFVVLFATLFIAMLLMVGLARILNRENRGEAVVNAPEQASKPADGAPTLDSDQRGSLRSLRAREARILTEHRWIDAENDLARIPIRRAMEILSQRPTTAPETPSNDANL
jgi:hypothetical protein